jgi:peroxiredoxin
MKKSLTFLTLFVGLSLAAQNKVPNTYLETTDGERVNIQSLTNTDNVTVLSFWATWCMPCLRELEAIHEVYPTWQEETGVELIAISTDDPRTQKRVKPLVNGKGWDFTILLDTNQELKRRFNISTIPHTIVVKNNEVIYRHSGYVPGAEKELYEIIKEHSK